MTHRINVHSPLNVESEGFHLFIFFAVLVMPEQGVYSSPSECKDPALGDLTSKIARPRNKQRFLNSERFSVLKLVTG
jgi:hypothetical protein